jgi:hypothetical protein
MVDHPSYSSSHKPIKNSFVPQNVTISFLDGYASPFLPLACLNDIRSTESNSSHDDLPIPFDPWFNFHLWLFSNEDKGKLVLVIGFETARTALRKRIDLPQFIGQKRRCESPFRKKQACVLPRLQLSEFMFSALRRRRAEYPHK